MSENSGVRLSWSASTEPVAGYHVYSASNKNASFKRVTSGPVTTLDYYDSAGSNAWNYMVRAVKSETSASGTYLNLSQGAFLNGIGEINLATAHAREPGVSTLTNGLAAPLDAVAAGTTVSWVDDGLPAGAVAGSHGSDTWNWVNSNPTPVSGKLASQSSAASGLHQHFFTYATNSMTVNTGEVLVAYVHLDPKNVPSELMLQWHDGSWEHRAYWGANHIEYGTMNTASRRYMGPLPPPGQWVRLIVPAQQVGLEGSTIGGMAFTLYDGRATWDNAGKATLPLTNTALAPAIGAQVTPTRTSSN
jgi:hypothetical protein